MLAEVKEASEELRRLHDLQGVIASMATDEQQSRPRVERLNCMLEAEGQQKVFVEGANRSDITKEIRSVLRGEVRVAMNTGTGSQGAYFVPAQFEKELVLMQLAAGPFYADSPLLTNIPTETGAPRLMPASDDLANVGYVQRLGRHSCRRAAKTDEALLHQNDHEHLRRRGDGRHAKGTSEGREHRVGAR